MPFKNFLELKFTDKTCSNLKEFECKQEKITEFLQKEKFTELLLKISSNNYYLIKLNRSEKFTQRYRLKTIQSQIYLSEKLENPVQIVVFDVFTNRNVIPNDENHLKIKINKKSKLLQVFRIHPNSGLISIQVKFFNILHLKFFKIIFRKTLI